PRQPAGAPGTAPAQDRGGLGGRLAPVARRAGRPAAGGGGALDGWAAHSRGGPRRLHFAGQPAAGYGAEVSDRVGGREAAARLPRADLPSPAAAVPLLPRHDPDPRFRGPPPPG